MRMEERIEELPARIEFITEEDGTREYRLSNNLKVLLVENRVAPVATFLVLYKVGSRNEAVGHTGATHLLEHMMFKGTPTFNKNENTQIAATLQKIGADFNATTWYDRTNYFETVPSDQLELAIKLEADRMRNSLIADSDRQSEMTVVRNELDRGQNEPMMVLDEAVYATAFREHPYHHPTIGWRADVENVPTVRLKAFYDTFYHPSNATAILVGDFNREEALDLINKYFGSYASSSESIPEVYTNEPEQQGERRVTVRRPGELALLQIAFHIPAALGQTSVLSNEELRNRAAAPPEENDIYPLVVLSTILTGGVSSRLYQALVETELAVHVVTNADQFRDPGLFNVYATVSPDVEPKTVEDAILSELERIANEEINEDEVLKAQGQILAHVAYARDGTHNVAAQMSEAEAVADWRFYKDYAANVERVTAADIRRVARKYFTEDNRTVGTFVPKHDAADVGESDGHGGNGSGAGALHAAKELKPPRRMQFFRAPESSETITTATDEKRDDADGASITPQAKEQQIVTERDDKSSDAVEAITAQSAPQTNFASRVGRTELGNGATLLLLENRATPIIALRGSLRAGSYFEPKQKPGLASLTAEMLERGTRRRSKIEIATALESVGAELSFSADAFSVSIGGRSLSKDLPMLLNTLAEFLREPSFPAEELEKLKQQVVADIQENQSNTRYRAYERLTQLLFDESNPFYVHSGERLIESINSITVKDVGEFYARQYGGRSLILSIAGDLNQNEIAGSFETNFGDFNGSENIEVNIADVSESRPPQRETVTVRGKASVDVLLGATAPLRRASEDYYAAVLANSALGQSTLSSRLGLEVRDRQGLTYGINSAFRAPGLAPGPWYVAVTLNPQTVEQALDSATGVLRDYIANGIREDELADEKSSAIGSFKVALSTNAGLASALWNAEFYRLGTNYIDRFPQIVEAVKAEEVNRAIRKYFLPENLTVVIAGEYIAAAPSEITTATQQ